jgi:hypothetical protein
MTPLLISRARLIWSLILSAVGCAIWIVAPWGVNSAAAFFFAASTCVKCTDEERAEVMPRIHWLYLLILVMDYVGLMKLLKVAFPTFNWHSVAFIFKHPLIIILVWAFASWILIERWKLGQAGMSDKAAEAQNGE